MTTISLTPTQAEWFNVASTEATELAIGGAAGSGKSYFLRAAAILYAIEIPHLKIMLFRRNVNDLVENHIEGITGFPVLLSEMMDAGLVKYNMSNKIFRFANGSTISLHHLQHEKDIYKVQGASIDVLLIDEATHFTDKQYRFLRSRVRMADKSHLPKKYKEVFPKIILSTNPTGVSHNEIKKNFVKAAPAKSVWKTPASEGGMYRCFYPALITDNPYMLKNDPMYVERLRGLGNDQMVQAFLEGNWDILAGSYFGDVWDETKHIIEPIDFDAKSFRFSRCLDWGWSAPAAVGWYATAKEDVTIKGRTYPRGTSFMYDELYTWNGEPNKGARWSPAQLAEEVRAREARYNYPVVGGPADRSIYDTDTNIASEMATVGVSWTPSDKSPGSRIRGWQTITQLLRNGMQSPMEKPGFFVTRDCSHFIRTINLCERDGSRPDDLDTTAEDHHLDQLRYHVLDKPKTVKATRVVGL